MQVQPALLDFERGEDLLLANDSVAISFSLFIYNS
jgi:hypothetical protein